MDVLVKRIVQKTHRKLPPEELLKLFDYLDRCLKDNLPVRLGEGEKKLYTNYKDCVVELEAGDDYVELLMAGKEGALAELRKRLEGSQNIWRIFRALEQGINIDELEDGCYIEEEKLFKNYEGKLRGYLNY